MLSPMPEESLEGETVAVDSVTGDAVLTDVSDTELEGVVVDGLVGHEGAPTPAHSHVSQRTSVHHSAGTNGISSDSVQMTPGTPLDKDAEVSYLKTEKNQKEVNQGGKQKMGTEEADLMKALERQLSATVEPDTPITYKMFKKALKIKDSYFGEHFFRVFDTDKSQTIEVSELLAALRRLTEGSATDKLKILFDIYDEDAFSAFPGDPPAKSTAVRMTSFHSLNLIADFTKSRKSNKSFKSRRSTYRRKPETNKIVNVPCFIDGPYGTPSREIFESEHAVLIGSGIGVTPFASILQSIIYRFKAVKRNCPNCSHAWYDDVPSHVMRLKKVDFIWINRDQKCFEWFVSLLAQLEMEQKMEGGLGHLLEMHMFMTSALNKTDMKGLGLQMALDLIHTQQNRDLLTGLQTRTQPGRPNFKKVGVLK